MRNPTRVLFAASLALVGTLALPAGAEDAPAGTVVFSKSPIDPAKPADLATSFVAGDTIYALVRFPKPFAQTYPGKDQVMIQFVVDGQAVFYQYLGLTTEAARARSYVTLDVAPDPARMSAYRQPEYTWGRGKKNKTLGPHAFTWALASLAKGEHTITIQDFDFGTTIVRGSFTIRGDDYAPYAARHEEIEKAMNAGAVMPPAGRTDADLEAKMRKLLENAGWKDVRALRIVDKDWWIDRVAGGDTAVKSRRMDAAVASKADDGTFYYCICTFQQPALVTGGFGDLELIQTGERRPIAEENIGK
jgi:hypothetical protein